MNTKTGDDLRKELKRKAFNKTIIAVPIIISSIALLLYIGIFYIQLFAKLIVVIIVFAYLTAVWKTVFIHYYDKELERLEE